MLVKKQIMSKVKIGTSEGNKPVYLDVQKLVESRLLLNANSGGGKSYLLRKILEETHGKVQQIVLDVEGEFSTLREKYDYLLVGKEGDIVPNLRAAELLAKKVLELKVSTIVDLYELKHHERILFVKKFLEAMINAPKTLWQPVMVIVDEAHLFCPESKSGKAESSFAVIDLETRGRKRGYMGGLATQRLAKLNKDAAAECNNVFVGRCTQDVDMKRGAELLGFTSKEQMRELRLLNPGEFFAFGPAISNEVIKVKIDPVITSHPEAGKRTLIVVPPAPSKIKQLIQNLADLPKEAEKELRTAEDLRRKVRELEVQLRSGKMPIDEQTLVNARDQGYNEALKIASKKFTASQQNNDILIKTITNAVSILTGGVDKTSINIKQEEPFGRVTKVLSKSKEGTITEVELLNGEIETWTSTNLTLGKCEREILCFLFSNDPKTFTKVQIAVATGYSVKSGGYNNALSKLNAAGFIEKRGLTLALTRQGNTKAIELNLDRNYEMSIEKWYSWLGKCEGKVLKILYEHREQSFSKTEIAEVTGYSSSSGGFNNAISKLNSLELIQKEGSALRFNQEFEGLI